MGEILDIENCDEITNGLSSFAGKQLEPKPKRTTALWSAAVSKFRDHAAVSWASLSRPHEPQSSDVSHICDVGPAVRHTEVPSICW